MLSVNNTTAQCNSQSARIEHTSITDKGGGGVCFVDEVEGGGQKQGLHAVIRNQIRSQTNTSKKSILTSAS